jgi:hypothetical protein
MAHDQHGESHFGGAEVRNVDNPRSQNVDVQQGHSMQRDTRHPIQTRNIEERRN